MSLKRKPLAVAISALLPCPALAAAVILEIGTPDTDTQPNTTAAFTPAVDDLLVIAASATATIEASPTMSCTSGGTFSLVNTQKFRTDLDSLYIFVANQLISSAVSQTCTLGTTDDFTGSNIAVLAVSGMTELGASAVLQEDSNSAGAASTPTTVWAGAATTTNPVISFVANGSNPATVTEPSGWTEILDQGHASPNHGLAIAKRDSGFTSNTVTWGSTGGTAYAVVSIELDASGSENTPAAFDSNPACSALDFNTMRCAVDAGADTATIEYCVLTKDATTPASNAAVETCTGGLVSDSVVATGASQNIDIELGSDPFPIADYYFVGKNVTLYNTFQSQLDETVPAPTGRQYVVKSGDPTPPEIGLFDGASPAVADGDYMDAPLACDSFALGAGANALTLAADTTYTIAGDDLSRNNCPRRNYDISVGDWSDPDPVNHWVNNKPAVWTGLDDEGGTIDPFLFAKDAALSIPAVILFEDEENDPLALTVNNNPSGGSVTGGDTWEGPLDTHGVYDTVSFEVEDLATDVTEQEQTVTVGDLVPDVVDDAVAAADTAIENIADFVGTAGTPEYSDTIVLGNVIRTDPVGGTLVPPDQEIIFIPSLGIDVGDCDESSIINCIEAPIVNPPTQPTDPVPHP